MPNPVIVIPGYYGSKLADRLTQDIVWLSAQGLLQPETTARALRFDPQDPDRLVPVAILEEVPLILPFFDVKVYEGLLTFLHDDQTLPPGFVLAFFYDWRRSMMHAADLLAGQIFRLLAETGKQQVNLIAHSFGGLVARACLEKHGLADKVDWLITLGAPHKGMHSTFRAVTEGSQVFTFSRPTIRDTARDFPSAYELLPNDAADGLFQVNGVQKDAFADDSWCVDQRMKALLGGAHQVVTGSLPTELPVKTCLIYGTRLKTTTLGQSDGAGKMKFIDSEDGDGTVSRVSSSGRGLTAPKAMLRFQVPFGIHSQLPNNSFVQQELLTPILLGRPFPDLVAHVRFRQEPFYIPLSTNLLVVSLVNDQGTAITNANVKLTIIGSTIRDQPVPFSGDMGDYAVRVKMPGPSVPHRQWRVEIDIPGHETIVKTGLLKGAA